MAAAKLSAPCARRVPSIMTNRLPVRRAPMATSAAAALVSARNKALPEHTRQAAVHGRFAPPTLTAKPVATRAAIAHRARLACPARHHARLAPAAKLLMVIIAPRRNARSTRRTRKSRAQPLVHSNLAIISHSFDKPCQCTACAFLMLAALSLSHSPGSCPDSKFTKCKVAPSPTPAPSRTAAPTQRALGAK